MTANILFRSISFLTLVFVSLPAVGAESTADSNWIAAHRQWQGAMGSSGLRRSIALGTSLGEWLNRSLSYRAAALAENVRLLRGADSPLEAEAATRSKSESKISQMDSLAPVSRFRDRNLLLRTTVRMARREESLRLDGRSDRVDLGLFLGASNDRQTQAYTGLGLVFEDTKGEPGFIWGERAGSGIGIRFDHGEILNERFAYSLRLEQLWWSGDAHIHRPAPQGNVTIHNEVAFARTLVNADLIARYRVWGGQLRWRSAIHYMQTDYEDQINNLSLPVVEPFGNSERLGVARTGLYQSWRLGRERQYSPYAELIADYELSNNMDSLIQDKTTITFKAGVAWLFGPSRRLQLEYQRFNGVNDRRVRDSVALVALVDL